MKVQDKDQFDAIMRVADFFVHQFNERREYSWRVTIGFWAAIIGSIAVIAPYRVQVDLWPKIAFGVVVICLHLGWLYGVFCADRTDKVNAFRLRDKAIVMMKVEGIEPPKFNADRSFISDWTVRFSISTTALLVIAAICVLSLPK